MTPSEAVHQALAGEGMTIGEIVVATNLTPKQVQNATQRLRIAGRAHMADGRWQQQPGIASAEEGAPRKRRRRGRKAGAKRAAKKTGRKRAARVVIDVGGKYNFMIDSDGDLALCVRDMSSDPVWIDGKEARRRREFLDRAGDLLAA